MITSVNIAEWGPCCSTAPTGMITVEDSSNQLASSLFVSSPRNTVGAFMAENHSRALERAPAESHSLIRCSLSASCSWRHRRQNILPQRTQRSEDAKKRGAWSVACEVYKSNGIKPSHLCASGLTLNPCQSVFIVG